MNNEFIIEFLLLNYYYGVFKLIFIIILNKIYLIE